jgi:microcystin-dependent protein
MGIEGRSSSSSGLQMLRHSHTINVTSTRQSSMACALDAAVERVMLDSFAEHCNLRRFSSISAASRGGMHNHAHSQL